MNYIQYVELDQIFEEGYQDLDSVSTMDPINIDLVIEESAEFATIMPLILSLITTAPAIIKLFAKIGKKITSKFSFLKGGGEKITNILINFANKWHSLYIKSIIKILELTKIFKKSNITEYKNKEKVAEALFYTVVFGLAVYSGITTATHIIEVVKNISHLEGIHMSVLESVLVAIKSKEIQEFITKIS